MAVGYRVLIFNKIDVCLQRNPAKGKWLRYSLIAICLPRLISASLADVAIMRGNRITFESETRSNTIHLIKYIMEENKAMKIYNLIILDESGSMSLIYNQALSGINETIHGIRQSQNNFPEQEHYVSVVTFEGNGMEGVKTRRVCEPIGKVSDLTKKDYQPAGRMHSALRCDGQGHLGT